MDVSAELAAHAAKFSTAVQDTDVPIQVDAGLLTAFDESPIEESEYSTDLESFLTSRSAQTTQALLNTLFSLPTTKSTLGPLAVLPPPLSLLPREKPLPAKKEETKWERFAKAKGISHRNKERDVWDEERQMFVPRWGKGGKNKDTEEAWIREIKGGDDADHDPIATARAERKARIAKNARQAAANAASSSSAAGGGGGGPTTSLASRMPAPAAIMSAKGKSRAAGAAEPSQAEKKSAREKRKMELERSMAITRGSTASLGKFDRKIEGEPKVKGVKRKFEPTAPSSFTSEKSTSLSILSSVGKPRPTEKRARVSSGGQGARPEGDVNVRKALRFHGREEARKGKSADRGGKKSGGKKGRK